MNSVVFFFFEIFVSFCIVRVFCFHFCFTFLISLSCVLWFQILCFMGFVCMFILCYYSLILIAYLTAYFLSMESGREKRKGMSLGGCGGRKDLGGLGHWETR